MKTVSDVYKPLLDRFITELAKFPTSEYAGIPHPFLPEIGKNYRLALKRIAIVGKETRGWGETLDTFIENYQKGKFDFSEEMAEFQNLDFKDSAWMGGVPTRSSFWGAWMNILAKVYGVEDWKDIQRGKFDILLESFAWGNANSIETWSSAGVDAGALGYNRAKSLSEKLFDSIELLIKAIDPHVVILTCSNDEKNRYLGSTFQHIENVDGRVSVYKRGELIVFHMPHPNGQRFYTGGANEFAKIVRDLLVKYKMFCPLPNVLKNGLQEEAKKILINECSGIHKFDAIAKVALELRKQHSYMTARSLCLEILNPAGHTTDRGTPFTGNLWGPCRLVSTAWNYFQTTQNKPEIAENIALAFTDVNGNYAYH